MKLRKVVVYHTFGPFSTFIVTWPIIETIGCQSCMYLFFDIKRFLFEIVAPMNQKVEIVAKTNIQYIDPVYFLLRSSNLQEVKLWLFLINVLILLNNKLDSRHSYDRKRRNWHFSNDTHSFVLFESLFERNLMSFGEVFPYCSELPVTVVHLSIVVLTLMLIDFK